MLFLLIISKALSKTFTLDIQLEEEKYYNISNEYDSADITIPGGQALMLVGWEDAVVKFEWTENNEPNTVTFTKDVGLSFFIFKDDAKIHIYFKSGISFYTMHMIYVGYGWRTYLTNMKYNNYLSIDPKATGYYMYYIQPYYINSRPLDFSELCSFEYYFGNRIGGCSGTSEIGPFNSNVGISNIDCEKGTKLFVYTSEEFMTSVPTIVDYPFYEIFDFLEEYKKIKHNLCFGGVESSAKMTYISGISLYKYVFIKNNIQKNPKEYNLTVSMKKNDGSIMMKEIRHGETFSFAFSGYYFVYLSIKSKKGVAQDFDVINGEQLELDENNQPKVFSFDDSKIPKKVVIKDSHGLIYEKILK